VGGVWGCVDGRGEEERGGRKVMLKMREVIEYLQMFKFLAHGAA
jgi:hypothetical protein